MKGTLFSADFVKDSNGNLRLLELKMSKERKAFAGDSLEDLLGSMLGE
jgi:hypothetical protein